MTKETGRSRMGEVELLGELLKRPVAVLALRFSNIERPVSYDELQARLDHRYAATSLIRGRNIERPSESEVKTQLNFLVELNLLEVVEEEYRITPRGAEAARELSPRTAPRRDPS